ncbi:MAG TPA: hypothetical protein VEB21_08310 [Terriglobales bacterium]|nr:hypothetical protein [Terriglobales bacterium]
MREGTIMLKSRRLEEELKKWRESRGMQTECRTVKVNGQSVTVLQRPKRSRSMLG